MGTKSLFSFSLISDYTPWTLQYEEISRHSPSPFFRVFCIFNFFCTTMRMDLLLLHCLLWGHSAGMLEVVLPSCLCFVWKIIKSFLSITHLPHHQTFLSITHLLDFSPHPCTQTMLRHSLCGIFENVKPDPEAWTTTVCAVFGCQPIPYAYTYTASLSQTLQRSPRRWLSADRLAEFYQHNMI